MTICVSAAAYREQMTLIAAIRKCAYNLVWIRRECPIQRFGKRQLADQLDSLRHLWRWFADAAVIFAVGEVEDEPDREPNDEP
jgi:hypothetical protein